MAIIPIRCDKPELQRVPLVAPRVLGPAPQAWRLVTALEAAVHGQLQGLAPITRWLRELRLGEGEVLVLIAPGLGCDGMDAAEIAFDTLRHLLPDTDIYVSAAEA